MKARIFYNFYSEYTNNHVLILNLRPGPDDENPHCLQDRGMATAV